jgi:integrase
VWEVRFSGKKDGKRFQRTEMYDCALYRTEKDVRKAIELTVSQVNSGTAGERADATFGTIINLYRAEHLPTLARSSRDLNAYLLKDYVEDRFGNTPLRDMRPIVIDSWIKSLKKLVPSTKASIRSVMSVCFTLGALHEFISPMAANPMTLIKIKGVTKRRKKIPEVTVVNFRRLLERLPEPLIIMVLVDGAYGLRVSEMVAPKWEDIDEKAKTLSIQRKFTRGELGPTKSESSEAPLPMAAAA